ncbi:MAG: S8 family serine peptidase [Proteobacteria bacterium]|nr:S8 family serine peptidase [Pseudomonadota bacterium]
MSRVRFRILLSVIAGLFSVPHASAETDIQSVLRAALATACASETLGIDRMASRIDERAAALHHQPLRKGAAMIGWSRSFLVKDLGVIEITRLAPGGTLANVQIGIHVSDGTRVLPLYSLVSGENCKIAEGRRLIYRANGLLDRLEILDRGFAPIGAAMALNPLFPPSDAMNLEREGIRIALVDSGVNYQLPHIANALARDGNKALGYDYWDLDPFPFDSDTSRSPFYPRHRGTKVASVLTLESPGVSLIPYRFPYPDVRRMVDLVRDAHRAKARIMLISFDTRGRGHWLPFKRAAARDDGILLVVSAGNGARDLDRDPLFPASLNLTNAVVVTGMTAAGEVLAGANWGTATVDIGVAAGQVEAIAFDGNLRSVSGPGVAAARIAALAARLLMDNRGWDTQRVRTEIIGRASHSDGTARRTRFGTIDLPQAGPASADPS